jgi:accessory Sec system glycosylation protein GtfA
MRQYYDASKEIMLTIVGNQVLQGRTAFYAEFFRRLNLKKGDLVVVDRNRETTDALFPITKANGVPVVNVIHAEHFNAARIEDDWIAWNNFYEFPFMNPQYLEYFITATEKQKEVFLDQMALMHKPTKALAIPVGSVHHISDGEYVKANKYKFMTASRLAWEKHIDVLVRAVVKAKAQVPELTFDIYGDGKFRGDLVKLIDELGAGDYITMQGHKNLEEEYDKYGGYLTASGSEGFGLSILEAVAACLPMIGLNVNYGNTEFVKSGINGILVEKTDEHEQIDNIAAAIVEMVDTLDYDAAIAWSKEKASHFTDDVIRQKWRDLYDEFVGNGGDNA